MNKNLQRCYCILLRSSLHVQSSNRIIFTHCVIYFIVCVAIGDFQLLCLPLSRSLHQEACRISLDQTQDHKMFEIYLAPSFFEYFATI